MMDSEDGYTALDDFRRRRLIAVGLIAFMLAGVGVLLYFTVQDVRKAEADHRACIGRHYGCCSHEH